MNKNLLIKRMEVDRDLDRVMDIWLDSNIDAHDFIDESYWKDNYSYVKSILPEADVYVAHMDGELVGFMGIDEGYIAGIFVDKERRASGIGSRLIEVGKESYNKLSLDLYKKNKNAYEFYLKKGFQLVAEKYDEENKEIEYTMEWSI